MEEPYGEAVATRTGPELWRYVRKGVPQALAGGRAGWVWSRVSLPRPGCRGRSPRPKALPAAPLARGGVGSRAVEDPRHARKLSARELGGPTSGRASGPSAVGTSAGGSAVRVVNPMGVRRR
jgi:hypothetical protein